MIYISKNIKFPFIGAPKKIYFTYVISIIKINKDINVEKLKESIRILSKKFCKKCILNQFHLYFYLMIK